MKPLLLVAIIFWCTSVQATGPEYWSSRAWIEEHTSTNQVSSERRVFIASCPGSMGSSFAAIIPFKDGLSLRDVIDQIRFLAARF
jgi:hypothetical protein